MQICGKVVKQSPLKGIRAPVLGKNGSLWNVLGCQFHQAFLAVLRGPVLETAPRRPAYAMSVHYFVMQTVPASIRSATGDRVNARPDARRQAELAVVRHRDGFSSLSKTAIGSVGPKVSSCIGRICCSPRDNRRFVKDCGPGPQ